MKNYVSLITDIEKSRKYRIDERNEIQSYISYCVNRLNELFRENLKYEVTFSAGDELQGLFYDVTTTLMYFRLLEMLLKPVKLRAGIGVGEWTIKVGNGLSTHQDGPVYHRARYAIQEVYKNQLHNIKICSDKDDVLANHLINASNALKDQQIYMQNIVLVILELLCPFVKNQMKVDIYEIIKDLLEIKFHYQIGKRNYSSVKRRVDYEKEKLSFPEVLYVNPIYIDGKIENAEEHIYVKGITTIISDILNCTRQNVDSIIRRGNANKIRELDYIALQYVEKIYGE